MSPGSAAAGSREPLASRDREFQLEARHLALLVLLVVALCAASYQVGRWVERRSAEASAPPGLAPDGRAPASVEDAGDVSRDLTFFDTLGGGDPVPLEAPPRARETPIRPRSAGASAPSAPRRSVSEGVMIQVFASKDRKAADSLRRRLRSRGYTALLVSEGGFHKVRVGPYADGEEAQRAAGVLREQEGLETRIP